MDPSLLGSFQCLGTWGTPGGVVGRGETIKIFSIVVIKYLIRYYLAQREDILHMSDSHNLLKNSLVCRCMLSESLQKMNHRGRVLVLATPLLRSIFCKLPDSVHQRTRSKLDHFRAIRENHSIYALYQIRNITCAD